MDLAEAELHHPGVWEVAQLFTFYNQETRRGLALPHRSAQVFVTTERKQAGWGFVGEGLQCSL